MPHILKVCTMHALARSRALCWPVLACWLAALWEEATVPGSPAQGTMDLPLCCTIGHSIVWFALFRSVKHKLRLDLVAPFVDLLS